MGNDEKTPPGSMSPRRRGCPFTKDHTGQDRPCNNGCGIWIPSAEDPNVGFCAIVSIAVSLAVLATPPE